MLPEWFVQFVTKNPQGVAWSILVSLLLGIMPVLGQFWRTGQFAGEVFRTSMRKARRRRYLLHRRDIALGVRDPIYASSLMFSKATEFIIGLGITINGMVGFFFYDLLFDMDKPLSETVSGIVRLPVIAMMIIFSANLVIGFVRLVSTTRSCVTLSKGIRRARYRVVWADRVRTRRAWIAAKAAEQEGIVGRPDDLTVIGGWLRA